MPDRAAEKLVSSGPIPTICAYLRKVRDPAFRCSLDCERGINFKKYRPRSRTPLRFRDRADIAERGEEYVYVFGRDTRWYWTRYHGPLALLTEEACTQRGA